MIRQIDLAGIMMLPELEAYEQAYLAENGELQQSPQYFRAAYPDG